VIEGGRKREGGREQASERESLGILRVREESEGTRVSDRE